MKSSDVNAGQTWKVFWPCWLMPAVLLIPSIYESSFGAFPTTIRFLILVICAIMFGYPLKHYINKSVSFERLAFFGYFIPFVIWGVLVFVKALVFELLTRNC